jgi:hypothetical protein
MLAAGEDRSSPVCSTTRVKSAIVSSLMIDGSGSRGCRIPGLNEYDTEQAGAKQAWD